LRSLPPDGGGLDASHHLSIQDRVGKLALAVGAMIEGQTPNTESAALGDRAAGHAGTMAEARWLKNPLLLATRVMELFAREALRQRGTARPCC